MRSVGVVETAAAVEVPAAQPLAGKSREDVTITYRQYEGEQDLPLIMALIDNELSEPYSIFTYRYFLHKWPQLCWMAFDGVHCFGTVVSKQDKHGELLRGYIAMLVVESAFRGFGVGTELVKRTIQGMVKGMADEVVLEAEVTNTGALTLYQNLGFIRDKYLTRYYLSGSDAYRLKLMLPLPPERMQELQDEQLVAAELDRMRLEAESSKGEEQAEGNRLGDLSAAATGQGSFDVEGNPIQAAGPMGDESSRKGVLQVLPSPPEKKQAKSKKTKRTKR